MRIREVVKNSHFSNVLLSSNLLKLAWISRWKPKSKTRNQHLPQENAEVIKQAVTALLQMANLEVLRDRLTV